MPRKIFWLAFRAALGIIVSPLLLNLLLVAGAEAATSEKVLYSFTGNNDGASPVSNLVVDSSGNLYGTASSGGADKLGTVFELSSDGKGGWTEQTIYSFKTGTDGEEPKAGLVLDASGNLYGTTYLGGVHGHGTVFELSPGSGGKWKEKILHSFTGLSEGGAPVAPLVFDSLGNLYGTNSAGGSHEYGAVFTLVPDGTGKWKAKAIHSFNNNGHDGYNPQAGLVFDSVGNLYGTTTYGGSHRYGVVFELAPSSNGKWKETIIHNFNPSNGHDGAYPFATPAFDAAGNLYGTTSSGGTSEFYGVVFQLAPQADGSWKEAILHNFTGASDGSEPNAGVILDSAGNVYGTTPVGGTDGIVFLLAPGSNGKWKETVLHNFKGASDGSRPLSSLIIDGKGNLYGTTSQGGGSANSGTVFQVTP